MIDLAIVSIYMITVLVVGIFSGFKIKNIEEYSISKNSFTTFAMIAAIFATLIGGGATMGVSEKVFSTGLIFIFACVGFVIRDLLIAIFVAHKIKNYEGCCTPGDIMARHYGPTAKVLVGIAGTLQSCAILGIQVSGLGHLLSYFIGMHYTLGVIIGMGVVVIYSAFGGIRAVTMTDVIQFSVMVVAVPLTFVLGVDMVGGYAGLFNSLPAQKLNLLPQSGDTIRFYSLFFVFCLPHLCPAILQRMLMGKDTQQVRQALVISAVTRLPYYCMVGILGLVAFVLEPSLQADLAFPYIVHQILPVGIKGFVIAGLLAVIMSTADSYLHLTGVMFTHDVIRPLCRNKLSDKKELLLVRLITLFIGSFSVIAAIYIPNMVELNILAYAFWLPGISIPLFAAIQGVHASLRCFIISALCGITTQFIWKSFFYAHTSIDSLLPAAIVSALSFFTINFFEKKKLQWKLATT